MRIAVASFEYEGNSLSLRVDQREDFERKGLVFKDNVLQFVEGKKTALSGGIETILDASMQVVPIVAAKGSAGGQVDERFFQELLLQIEESVQDAMPLDGIYFALHGAMICTEETDPEGAILARLRSIVGLDLPIAISLDLHAHVSNRMVEHADIIVGYETYPHIDAYETGIRAARLLVAAVNGEIKPVTRIKKYNAIFPVLGGSTLEGAPMAGVAQQARKTEIDNKALSVSYFPVQPWLDMEDVGITGLAVTNADPEGAEMVAQEILDAMWAIRHEFELPSMIANEAVCAALVGDARTTLLVDTPDSIGGGSAGDCPRLLAAIIKHALHVSSALCIYDPNCAARAFELGIGAEAEFQVGAWLDSRWHPPVSVTATVESLHDGRFVYSGGPAANLENTLGPTAVLRVGGLRLLCASHAAYEHMDEHYAACGVDIKQCRLVSCKNLMNFRKLLADDVDYIAIHGLGSTPLRLQDVTWQNRREPFWPQDHQDPPDKL